MSNTTGDPLHDLACPSTAAAAAGSRAQFASDVQFYLSQEPRQLPSRYLYDALGSALFEAICELPWYAITRDEQQLLKQHAAAIVNVESPPVIVELGPGSGEKLTTLLAAAVSSPGRPAPHWLLHLIDISPSALDLAIRTIESSIAAQIVSHQGTYEDGLSAFAAQRSGHQRALVLFLGSNIGNFDEPGREALLRTVRRSLRRGDALLLGADLIKPEHELRLAYDDPLGVTAAFNRNLLVRINRELNGDFDLDGFVHCAVWNAAHSRIEMHLVSQRRQRIRITDAQLDFEMAADESIWTESSYKYTPQGIAEALGGCGFTPTAQWLAPTFAPKGATAGKAEARFALTLAEAR